MAEYIVHQKLLVFYFPLVWLEDECNRVLQCLSVMFVPGVNPVTFEDWEKIDQVEKSNGGKVGKPREKIVNVQKMLECVKP